MKLLPIMHYDSVFQIRHSIRCYQELRKDALAVLRNQPAAVFTDGVRHSLFSSRKNYRTEELVLGLQPFAGFAFGVN